MTNFGVWSLTHIDRLVLCRMCSCIWEGGGALLKQACRVAQKGGMSVLLFTKKEAFQRALRL